MKAKSGISSELRREIAERKEELAKDHEAAEIPLLRGRHLTDNNALQHPEVRRHERFQRRAPKLLAKMNLFRAESTKNGIETEDGEVADRVTQRDILEAVDIQTQRKKFNLVLDKLGPYKIGFSLNGSHLALGGLRGHFATVSWKDAALVGETQLKDKINDLTFLVDHSMIAVAQKRFVYMYTKEGVEMHILSKMANMDKITYLPKHMLLAATSSIYSVMQYIDVSTGQELGQKPPSVMKDPTACVSHNPATGVVTTSDMRGVVKFWSPSVVDPLLQLKGHRGPITDIAFHDSGRFFVTLGGDHKMKVWDCRTMRALEEFAVTYTFDTVDVSSSGLVALGGGTNIQIWKDMFTAAKPSAPYLKFGLGYGNIAHHVKFCPFEDVLGIGHSRGFSSLLVPGSGEANPDIYFANPYETERHRKDRVVTNLLDKLPPDTISMDLQIAGVDEKRLEEYAKNLALNRKAKAIREKKQRRADRSLGEAAPTGLTGIVANEDELDEELGYKEKGPVKELKSKKEMQAERKKKKWDNKETTDKVRSKQTMRHSRIVQKKRATNARQEKRIRQNGGPPVPGDDSTDAVVGSKRARGDDGGFSDHHNQGPRLESSSSAVTDAKEEIRRNAAFRRFLS
jgi:U3 small nucleolar RNA-associated protein 7